MGRARKQIHGAIYTDGKGNPSSRPALIGGGADPGKTAQAEGSYRQHAKAGTLRKDKGNKP